MFYWTIILKDIYVALMMTVTVMSLSDGVIGYLLLKLSLLL